MCAFPWGRGGVSYSIFKGTWGSRKTSSTRTFFRETPVLTLNPKP